MKHNKICIEVHERIPVFPNLNDDPPCLIGYDIRPQHGIFSFFSLVGDSFDNLYEFYKDTQFPFLLSTIIDKIAIVQSPYPLTIGLELEAIHRDFGIYHPFQVLFDTIGFEDEKNNNFTRIFTNLLIVLKFTGNEKFPPLFILEGSQNKELGSFVQFLFERSGYIKSPHKPEFNITPDFIKYKKDVQKIWINLFFVYIDEKGNYQRVKEFEITEIKTTKIL